jgi:hypothetical protein
MTKAKTHLSGEGMDDEWLKTEKKSHRRNESSNKKRELKMAYMTIQLQKKKTHKDEKEMK